jgi:pimeloyl-ACP methyl ester carboxylesterase
MTTTEGGLPQGELGVDAGIAESDVNFYSDGYLLRGVLVLPSGDGAHSPRPAVIYTHGWSGAVNDRALPLLRLLAARGYVGIAIDHRGFAGSDGPTRARCDPREQARDVANTVTYLSTRGDVASDRIAVIGASFGGAIAVAAGALDRRLVGVVSMVGIGDGGRWLQSLHGDQWSRVQERLAADAVLRSRTGVGERVPFTQLMPSNAHSAPDDPVVLMYPEGYPLENIELAANFRPQDDIGRIAPRPVCIVGVDDDSVVPVEESLALHAAADEPKQLVRFPVGDHGGPLGPLVEQSAQVIVDFLAPLTGVGAQPNG